MRDVYLSDAATHDHIPGCDANCFGEPMPGRWIRWCVTHDAMGWGSPSAGCANPAAGTKSCRWHPQGAFIPNEGGTTNE